MDHQLGEVAPSLLAVTDWTTISAFATGAGTLVLAVATFSSVRSANRSARTAERSLLANLRPFLMHARPDDPVEKIMWVDEHWASVGGGRAVVDRGDAATYLAMPLRNAGSGLAVLHGWRVDPSRRTVDAAHAGPEVLRALDHGRPDPADFHRQSRDLYVPSGDTGFWQAAVRGGNGDDDLRTALDESIRLGWVFSIDLLYSDSEGGQRTISRFSMSPKGDDAWVCSVTQHWNLDRDDPR